MLYQVVLLIFGLVSSTNGLRLAPTVRTARSSTPMMGLAVGDAFPSGALASMGVKGKKAVVFFYGADDAPSCSKELSAFDAELATFGEAGVTVVGVRNAAGAKGTDAGVKLFVDEDDAIRNEIGIEKDLFGLLGGRETYVVDSSGKVASVFNSQFDPAAHVSTALDAIGELPKSPLEGLQAQLDEVFGKIKL